MSIETILTEHELVWDESGSWAVCDCGRHPYPQSLAPDDLPAAHRAHQADIIRAELTGDEVVEAVARGIFVVLEPALNAQGDRDRQTRLRLVAMRQSREAARAAIAALVETLGAE